MDEGKIRHDPRHVYFVKVKNTAKRSRSVPRYRRCQEETTLTSYWKLGGEKTVQKRAFSEGTRSPTTKPAWVNQKKNRAKVSSRVSMRK